MDNDYGAKEMIKPELHGMIKTSEYNSWTCMKQRCYNKAIDLWEANLKQRMEKE